MLPLDRRALYVLVLVLWADKIETFSDRVRLYVSYKKSFAGVLAGASKHLGSCGVVICRVCILRFHK